MIELRCPCCGHLVGKATATFAGQLELKCSGCKRIIRYGVQIVGEPVIADTPPKRTAFEPTDENKKPLS